MYSSGTQGFYRSSWRNTGGRGRFQEDSDVNWARNQVIPNYAVPSNDIYSRTQNDNYFPQPQNHEQNSSEFQNCAWQNGHTTYCQQTRDQHVHNPPTGPHNIQEMNSPDQNYNGPNLNCYIEPEPENGPYQYNTHSEASGRCWNSKQGYHPYNYSSQDTQFPNKSNVYRSQRRGITDLNKTSDSNLHQPWSSDSTSRTYHYSQDRPVSAATSRKKQKGSSVGEHRQPIVRAKRLGKWDSGQNKSLSPHKDNADTAPDIREPKNKEFQTKKDSVQTTSQEATLPPVVNMPNEKQSCDSTNKITHTPIIDALNDEPNNKLGDRDVASMSKTSPNSRKENEIHSGSKNDQDTINNTDEKTVTGMGTPPKHSPLNESKLNVNIRSEVNLMKSNKKEVQNFNTKSSEDKEQKTQSPKNVVQKEEIQKMYPKEKQNLPKHKIENNYLKKDQKLLNNGSESSCEKLSHKHASQESISDLPSKIAKMSDDPPKTLQGNTSSSMNKSHNEESQTRVKISSIESKESSPAKKQRETLKRSSSEKGVAVKKPKEIVKRVRTEEKKGSIVKKSTTACGKFPNNLQIEIEDESATNSICTLDQLNTNTKIGNIGLVDKKAAKDNCNTSFKKMDSAVVNVLMAKSAINDKISNDNKLIEKNISKKLCTPSCKCLEKHKEITKHTSSHKSCFTCAKSNLETKKYKNCVSDKVDNKEKTKRGSLHGNSKRCNAVDIDSKTKIKKQTSIHKLDKKEFKRSHTNKNESLTSQSKLKSSTKITTKSNTKICKKESICKPFTTERVSSFAASVRDKANIVLNNSKQNAKSCLMELTFSSKEVNNEGQNQSKHKQDCCVVSDTVHMSDDTPSIDINSIKSKEKKVSEKNGYKCTTINAMHSTNKPEQNSSNICSSSIQELECNKTNPWDKITSLSEDQDPLDGLVAEIVNSKTYLTTSVNTDYEMESATFSEETRTLLQKCKELRSSLTQLSPVENSLTTDGILSILSEKNPPLINETDQVESMTVQKDLTPPNIKTVEISCEQKLIKEETETYDLYMPEDELISLTNNIDVNQPDAINSAQCDKSQFEQDGSFEEATSSAIQELQKEDKAEKTKCNSNSSIEKNQPTTFCKTALFQKDYNIMYGDFKKQTILQTVHVEPKLHSTTHLQSKTVTEKNKGTNSSSSLELMQQITHDNTVENASGIIKNFETNPITQVNNNSLAKRSHLGTSKEYEFGSSNDRELRNFDENIYLEQNKAYTRSKDVKPYCDNNLMAVDCSTHDNADAPVTQDNSNWRLIMVDTPGLTLSLNELIIKMRQLRALSEGKMAISDFECSRQLQQSNETGGLLHEKKNSEQSSGIGCKGQMNNDLDNMLHIISSMTSSHTLNSVATSEGEAQRVSCHGNSGTKENLYSNCTKNYRHTDNNTLNILSNNPVPGCDVLSQNVSKKYITTIREQEGNVKENCKSINKNSHDIQDCNKYKKENQLQQSFECVHLEFTDKNNASHANEKDTVNSKNLKENRNELSHIKAGRSGYINDNDLQMNEQMKENCESANEIHTFSNTTLPIKLGNRTKESQTLENKNQSDSHSSVSEVDKLLQLLQGISNVNGSVLDMSQLETLMSFATASRSPQPHSHVAAHLAVRRDDDSTLGLTGVETSSITSTAGSTGINANVQIANRMEGTRNTKRGCECFFLSQQDYNWYDSPLSPSHESCHHSQSQSYKFDMECKLEKLTEGIYIINRNTELLPERDPLPLIKLMKPVLGDLIEELAGSLCTHELLSKIMKLSISPSFESRSLDMKNLKQILLMIHSMQNVTDDGKDNDRNRDCSTNSSKQQQSRLQQVVEMEGTLGVWSPFEDKTDSGPFSAEAKLLDTDIESKLENSAEQVFNVTTAMSFVDSGDPTSVISLVLPTLKQLTKDLSQALLLREIYRRLNILSHKRNKPSMAIKVVQKLLVMLTKNKSSLCQQNNDHHKQVTHSEG